MPGPLLAGLDLSVRSPVDLDCRLNLGAHLLRLGPDSRQNRFLSATSDSAVWRYAETTAAAAVIHAWRRGRVVGIAEVHIRPGRRPVAEIALSVEEGDRDAGIGSALFDKALRECRKRGVWEIWIVYLRTNEPIRRISERAGFTPVPDMDPGIVQSHVGRPLPPEAAAARRLDPPGRIS
ncbi:hypothetical protein DEA8626_00555 [Defluviimonas aquaemixtae]|uniref:N-acetyltransferase domain-containing protein n=1 Tax=Albidovulum aquaemixtae TaxID=1542388 RepID=A0A2R8B313_9RHOB|nr:GNAT family N-acetyltransferase [Defluviimonas aquaemixtae]SPH17041.1 hypothetical protein DEA8626_00555 [Defluviimonas aquaemixtae]